jgi:hypothetical protein
VRIFVLRVRLLRFPLVHVLTYTFSICTNGIRTPQNSPTAEISETRSQSLPWIRSLQDTVTYLIDALPGNSPVNTVQHASIDESLFSMSSAPRPVLLMVKSTCSDMWHVFSGWSVPCNNREAVFSAHSPCPEDIRKYGNGNWLHLNSEVPREQ